MGVDMVVALMYIGAHSQKGRGNEAVAKGTV